MTALRMLPWHQEGWQQFQRCRQGGRLPHALMICGPRGVGKGEFALRLAAAMLCRQPTATGDACGQCRGCRMVTAESHPDLRRVEPAEPGKAIRVDQVRGLCEFIALKAQFGGSKVAIIVPAENMNRNAANALLKTLEEPPADTLLLLVTRQPAKLPATVRSRCQQTRLLVPEREPARTWLLEQEIAEPDLYLDLAEGAPLEALRLKGPEGLALRDEVIGVLREVAGGEVDPVRAAARFDVTHITDVCRWMLSCVTDMIRLAMVPGAGSLRNGDRANVLIGMARGRPLQELFERQEELAAVQRITVTSINKQLMLEDLLARWVPRQQSRQGGGRRMQPE